MTINHKMVPYMTPDAIQKAFKKKYNEDIDHLSVPNLLFDDYYANDSSKKVYIDDEWWKDDISYEYENKEEMRIVKMIMDMLFEEFYPHRYVLVDVTW